MFSIRLIELDQERNFTKCMRFIICFRSYFIIQIILNVLQCCWSVLKQLKTIKIFTQDSLNVALKIVILYKEYNFDLFAMGFVVWQTQLCETNRFLCGIMRSPSVIIGELNGERHSCRRNANKNLIKFKSGIASRKNHKT